LYFALGVLSFVVAFLFGVALGQGMHRKEVMDLKLEISRLEKYRGAWIDQAMKYRLELRKLQVALERRQRKIERLKVRIGQTVTDLSWLNRKIQEDLAPTLPPPPETASTASGQLPLEQSADAAHSRGIG
jgi:chromosome segregation ATPase